MCHTSINRAFWEVHGSVSATCELQFRAACSFVPLVFKEEESFVCALSGFNSGVLKKKLKSRKDHPLLGEQYLFPEMPSLFKSTFTQRVLCFRYTFGMCL